MDLVTEVDNYTEIISGHPIFNAAYKKLRKKIKHAVSGNILFLFGPTGVGKSTLLKQLIRDILKESSHLTSVDTSLLPIVRIEVDYPSSRQFSWPEFYRNGLIAIQEPLIDKKLKNLSARSDIDLKKYKLGDKPPGYILKLAFLEALSKRQTRILLLDEAHHIAKGFEGQELYHQLEYIKTLASKSSNRIIVLAGTYKLLSFLNLNAQLTRRGIDGHFPRYKANINKEMKEFVALVKAFRKHSPLAWEDEILEDMQYLYTYSAGCVGILKEWFDRAHKEALDNGDVTLSLKHLQSEALSIEKMKIISEEMVEGERLLEPNEGDLSIVQELLGIKDKSNSIQKADGYEQVSAKPAVIPKPKKRQVGIRNAKRDVIGLKKDDIS